MGIHLDPHPAHLGNRREDSEYVLSYEIGQREGGFYSGRIII